MSQAGLIVATGGGGGGGDLNTLDPDTGGPISPSGGNINIFGGTGIDTTGAGSTITINFDVTEVPTIPNSFPTNSGTAVPALNSLQFTGYDSPENDVDGLTSKGGVAAGDPPGTGLSNEVSFYLTNRIVGTATTTDAATPQPIYSYTLPAIAGTYILEVRVIGFNATDNLSAGYTSFRVLRSTGAALTEISATPGIITEETTMTGVLVVNGVSGNAVTLTVNGLAGKIIYWRALTTYIFVSAP